MRENTSTNVRLSDIAAELGITVNTVSKAIRGKGGVSERCRKQVLAVADRMGYVPNRVATSLRYGQSKMIAVIFDNLMNPYFMIMTELLFSRLRALDYDVMIFAGIYDQIKPNDLSNILSRKVDGIITFIEPSEKVLEILERNRIRIVLLGRENPQLNVDSVSTDDFMGGYRVGEYLLSKGAKNIGYLGSPKQVECARRRLEGLQKCLSDHGQTFCDANAQFMDRKEMNEQAMRLLQNRVDAVFCFNDIMALEFISIVRQNGLRVPEDVRVVGYDDIQEDFPLAVNLTTVSSDKQKCVDSAVELLLQKINGEREAESCTRLNSDVHVRSGETA